MKNKKSARCLFHPLKWFPSPAGGNPTHLILILFIMTTSVFAAKSGPTYEIPADSVGSSGTSQGASSTGYRLRYTVGAIGAAAIASSSAPAYSVTPGIWAGAPALNPQNNDAAYIFGPEGGRGHLLIPSGALTQDYLLYSTTSPATQPLRVSPAVIAEARSKLDRTVSPFTRPAQNQVWELYLQEEDGHRASATFQKPATLTLPYMDDNADGLLDGSAVPVRINTLSIWWLDESHSLWVRLPSSAVNISSKTVTASVGHLSVFAVMGAPNLDPSAAYAYPVPWRPGGPKAGEGPQQTGTLAGGITFTNMPDIATIRIYTVSGSLVRELNHTSGPTEIFNVKSDAGEILATGTYVYVIDSNGTKKTGKLAIIR